MIIFGWGKRTAKNYGSFEKKYCSHCSNTKNWNYIKYTTWFTLFFIPVIPYELIYARICPICGNHEIMEKDEFYEVTGSSTTNPMGYSNEKSVYNDNLTDTQRNFRKQMDEFNKSRNL